MVKEDGGPEVVFPGLDDIDAKYGEEIPEYDYDWENEQVKHITLKQDEYRRRYLLRTRYRIKCHNSLGFVWERKKNVTFEKRLEQMKSYIEEHGHYNVPRDYGGIGGLGEWFHTIKTNFVKKKKYFMEEQCPKLLEIGVDMNVAVVGRRKRRRKARTDVDENNRDSD